MIFIGRFRRRISDTDVTLVNDVEAASMTSISGYWPGRALAAVSTVLLPLAIACGNDPSGGTSGPTMAYRSAVTTKPSIDGDERLLTVARKVPEFGGTYVENGRLLILLVGSSSQSKLASAQAVIAKVLNRPALLRLHAVAINARYTFTELKGWFDQVAPAVLAIPGVVSVDIDDVRNVIQIGVSKAGDADTVRTTVQQAGMPPTALRIEAQHAIGGGLHDQPPRSD